MLIKVFIKKWFKKYWRWVVLLLLAITFFIGTSSYNYLTQENGFVKWQSPDEAANYIFAKLYSQTGELTIFEKYNLYTNDIMYPRSTRSDFGVIKPVSFTGLIIIYGQIASWTSYKVLPYLTPILAALGIIFFYLLIKKIFNRRNGLISAFLLASLSPFIYYSARSMFHNVLFIVLLIIGLYFSVLMVKQRIGIQLFLSWLYVALGGFFIGLAVITRSSELLWLAPMLMILWIFNIKKVGFFKLVLFLSFLFLALLPAFYWNQILHSSPWRSGYPEMNQSVISIAQAGSGMAKSITTAQVEDYKELWQQIKNNIFYFGFHPRHSLRMFSYYFVRMLYWLFWPAMLGGILFLQRWRKWKIKHWAYIVSYFVISLILILYYGSWEFHDNPDPSQFTIGNSYTRYWLPVYLGAMPFASMFIIRLTRLARKKFFINCARVIIISSILFISLQFVLIGSAEGLIQSAQKQKQTRQERDKVLSLTEHNATIITRYHDKLFFPQRKVIVGLFNNKATVAQYANLVDYLPVYYYNFTLPLQDIDYLNNKRLAEVGLRIKKVKQVSQDFTLYKLHKK